MRTSPEASPALARSLILFGIAPITLGIVGFAFSDFALQWQPVPERIPFRSGLIDLSAASLLVAGSMLVSRRLRLWGAAGLAVIYGLWVLALHLPRAMASPQSVGAWLGPAELTALAAGAALATGLLSHRFTRLRRPSLILYGLCAMIFGASHFAYPTITASLVPAWIPLPLFWAYFTGAAHIMAGLAIISGKWSRLAATLLAAMMGSFALLVHVPRVVGSPKTHAEWVMLAIATALAASALLVRASLCPNVEEEPTPKDHAPERD